MNHQTTYADKAANEFLRLNTISSQLDSDTQNRLQKGELRLEDGVFYVAAHVSGQGGRQDLVTESVNLKKGTVNFDKSALPKLENMILKTIRFGYANVNDETDPAKVKYSSKIPANMDQAISRASLIIRQEDKILFERPIADIMSDESERGSNRGYNLENFRLIKGDRKLEIVLDYPEGQSVQAAGAAGTPRHHVEVRLIGSKTKVK